MSNLEENKLNENNSNIAIVNTSNDQNNKYTIPKNAKKLDENELQQLSLQEIKEYEKAMTRPKKVGYAIFSKRFNHFYVISILDFLPFFLGSIYSFIRFCIGYGDIKSQINFDKKLQWDFKSIFLLGVVYTFLVVPIILILIAFIYPFIILGGNEVTKAWTYFFDSLNDGHGLGVAISQYSKFAISRLFYDTNLFITCSLFLALSMINTKTFLYQFLLRQRRDNVFVVQKQGIKEEIIKLKVSKKK